MFINVLLFYCYNLDYYYYVHLDKCTFMNEQQPLIGNLQIADILRLSRFVSLDEISRLM